MDEGREDAQLSRINSLPRDIILDILSRLPMLYLMQISLVCRSWRDNSRDQSLSGMHLSHRKQNDPCLMLQVLPKEEMCFVGFSGQNKDKGMVKKIFPSFSKFQMVASCDGLLCLFQSYTVVILICNPITRTCIEVPRSPLLIREVLGFGSSWMSKEHKILVWVTLDTKTGPPQEQTWFSFHRFCVLTIGSSTWRELDDENYNFVRPSMQVLVNGRLHWTTRPSTDHRAYWTWHQNTGCGTYSIISFDLEDEQFRDVGRPACGGLDNMRYQLVELRGYLSAAAECKDGRIKIWVMKSYDARESWINEYVIGTYLPKQLQTDNDGNYRNVKFLSSGGSLVKILCLHKDNEILFQYNCRSLVSYSPETGTFTEHTSNQMPAVFDAIIYEG